MNGHVLGTLVRDSQAVYNRDGPVPGLVGLIDAIEAAKLPETDADSGRGWAAVLVVVAAVGAASALALFALRRRRLQRNTG